MKIVCKQCGEEFVLEEGEVEFYESKNLALPKRCKRCRNSNKKKYKNFKVVDNKSRKGENYESNYKSHGKNYAGSKGSYKYNNSSNKSTDTENKNSIGNISSYNGDSSAESMSGYNTSTENTVANDKGKKKKTPLMAGVASVFVVAAMAVSGLFGGAGNTAGNPNDTAIVNEVDIADENQADSLDEVFGNDTSAVENQQAVQKVYEFRNEELYIQHYEKHGIEMGFASAQEYLDAANAAVNNPEVLHKIEAEDGDDVYFVEATGEFVVVSTDGYIRTYYIADKDYFERQ